MKAFILYFVFFFLFIQFTLGQEGTDLEVDAPKICFGINIPFGVSMYIPNVYKKFGMYCTSFQGGDSGKEDKNSISQWHELVSDQVINSKTFTFGLTYRLWKPFQCYAGLGLGWQTRQQIYKDTPPSVLPDAYRTTTGNFKPNLNFGMLVSLWRVSLGVGYDTYIQNPVYFIGYVIKVKKS
jgi:hypothetical protein